MSDTPNTGKFIVIDGTDGSGKTVQCQLLIERLKKEGFQVMSADFPQYGTKSAGLVEEYLNGKYGQVNAYAASLFYALDRYDASFKIRQWLAEGYIVVSNRYVTANAGHQGGKIGNPIEREKYFHWLQDIEYNILGIPKPDINIILHVPAELAQTLVDKKDSSVRNYAEGKKRDLHEADLEHMKNAEKVYLELADILPNTELVECMEHSKLLSIETVHNRIWSVVTNTLAVQITNITKLTVSESEEIRSNL